MKKSFMNYASQFLGAAFLATTLGCMDCGSSENERRISLPVQAVNLMDGVGNIDVKRESDLTTGPEEEVATNLAYTTVSPAKTFTGVEDGTFRGFPAYLTATTTQLIRPRPLQGGHKLVIFYFGTATAPQSDYVRTFGNRGAARPQVFIGAFDHADPQEYDVYVTAPGQDLAGVQPDFSVKYPQLNTVGGVVHDGGILYQVRLTAKGAKNVLVDFGNATSASDQTDVFVLSRQGTSRSHLKYSFSHNTP